MMLVAAAVIVVDVRGGEPVAEQIEDVFLLRVTVLVPRVVTEREASGGDIFINIAVICGKTGVFRRYVDAEPLRRRDRPAQRVQPRIVVRRRDERARRVQHEISGAVTGAVFQRFYDQIGVALAQLFPPQVIRMGGRKMQRIYFQPQPERGAHTFVLVSVGGVELVAPPEHHRVEPGGADGAQPLARRHVVKAEPEILPQTDHLS